MKEVSGQKKKAEIYAFGKVISKLIPNFRENADILP